jgi:hypothetical protein
VIVSYNVAIESPIESLGSLINKLRYFKAAANYLCNTKLPSDVPHKRATSLHIHATPRQIEDSQRTWIREEYNIFISLLRDLHGMDNY